MDYKKQYDSLRNRVEMLQKELEEKTKEHHETAKEENEDFPKGMEIGMEYAYKNAKGVIDIILKYY